MLTACAQLLSHIRLFVTLWIVVHQAPLSMEFPRQEYWSGLPFTSPGDLPNSGIEPMSLTSPALAGRFFTTSSTPRNPHSSQGNQQKLTKHQSLEADCQSHCCTPWEQPSPSFLPVAGRISFVFPSQKPESSIQPGYRTFPGKAFAGYDFKPDTMTHCTILWEIRWELFAENRINPCHLIFHAILAAP